MAKSSTTTPATESFDTDLQAAHYELAVAAIGAMAWPIACGYPDDLTDEDLQRMKPALLELSQATLQFFQFINQRNRSQIARR